MNKMHCRLRYIQLVLHSFYVCVTTIMLSESNKKLSTFIRKCNKVKQNKICILFQLDFHENI